MDMDHTTRRRPRRPLGLAALAGVLALALGGCATTERGSRASLDASVRCAAGEYGECRGWRAERHRAYDPWYAYPYRGDPWYRDRYRHRYDPFRYDDPFRYRDRYRRGYRWGAPGYGYDPRFGGYPYYAPRYYYAPRLHPRPPSGGSPGESAPPAPPSGGDVRPAPPGVTPGAPPRVAPPLSRGPRGPQLREP
jgi:hypothetical protein